jgi:hypothetical protein
VPQVTPSTHPHRRRPQTAPPPSLAQPVSGDPDQPPRDQHELIPGAGNAASYALKERSSRPTRYNPYLADYFFDANSGKPIWKARWVAIENKNACIVREYAAGAINKLSPEAPRALHYTAEQVCFFQ